MVEIMKFWLSLHGLLYLNRAQTIEMHTNKFNTDKDKSSKKKMSDIYLSIIKHRSHILPDNCQKANITEVTGQYITIHTSNWS